MEKVEIACRCKDCTYSERYSRECDTMFYCYYWDYEQGMSPNMVDAQDFCSNGQKREKGGN